MAAILYKWFLGFAIFFHANGEGMKNDVPLTRAHPFYVSVTEINHNASEKTLEVSCKIFADDLEQVLEKNFQTSLDIVSGKDETSFNRLIPQYISKHLAIRVDGKPVALSYIGYEAEKESAWCYFQVDKIPSVKNLEVDNSILYDFVDSEINIMHVTVGGKRKSVRVVFPEKNASFSF